jgi:hypothetical protein
MSKKFFHFVAGEILYLSVGYLAGLTASNLVSRFFVQKKLVNLWGLTAQKKQSAKRLPMADVRLFLCHWPDRHAFSALSDQKNAGRKKS